MIDLRGATVVHNIAPVLTDVDSSFPEMVHNNGTPRYAAHAQLAYAQRLHAFLDYKEWTGGSTQEWTGAATVIASQAW